MTLAKFISKEGEVVTVNIHEAMTHFWRLLAQVEAS